MVVEIVLGVVAVVLAIIGVAMLKVEERRKETEGEKKEYEFKPEVIEEATKIKKVLLYNLKALADNPNPELVDPLLDQTRKSKGVTSMAMRMQYGHEQEVGKVVGEYLKRAGRTRESLDTSEIYKLLLNLAHEKNLTPEELKYRVTAFFKGKEMLKTAFYGKGG